jgi:hypothetical protein
MKPTSRPVPPAGRPRTAPHAPSAPRVRRPRRVPVQVLEPEPEPEPDPDLEVDDQIWSNTASWPMSFEPEPQARVRRSRRLILAVLVGVGVVVLLLECVAIVRTLVSDDGDGRVPVTGTATPLVAPDALPAEGVLVRSEVRADGSVKVDQWIRSGDGIGELSFSAPAGVEGADAVRATGGRLVGADGTILADDLSLGAEPRRIRFESPTTMVRATYVLQGAVDRSATVDGRLLARVVALDVDFPAQSGPAVVVVSADDGGEVRNLACVNGRSTVALLRPCGAPDGPRWRVRLPAESRTDRVTAQVDLS